MVFLQWLCNQEASQPYPKKRVIFFFIKKTLSCEALAFLYLFRVEREKREDDLERQLEEARYGSTFLNIFYLRDRRIASDIMHPLTSYQFFNQIWAPENFHTVKQETRSRKIYRLQQVNDWMNDFNKLILRLTVFYGK